MGWHDDNDNREVLDYQLKIDFAVTTTIVATAAAIVATVIDAATIAVTAPLSNCS